MQISAAFLDPTAAMLDRLLRRSVVLNLYGDSYRLRDHSARAEELHRTTTGTRQPYGEHRAAGRSAYGPPRKCS